MGSESNFLDRLNAASTADFVALLDGTYEHSPWIAERAAAARPFTTPAALKVALARVVREASVDEQLGLIRAHPELAGKAAVAGELTAESTNEQQKAGLTACTPEEFARLQKLNADYNARFGFPFILAVRGPRGTGFTRAEIIATFERRLRAHLDVERAECLRQIHRIAEIRLNDKFGVRPALGEQLWDWAAALAVHSETEDFLTCTYATPAHTAVAEQLMAWMRDCGFDDVSRDAVGNVVGIYNGTGDQRLLTGSHFDTVRRAGRFDGRLGIFVPMLAVRELHRAGRRLPFGIEVVGFSEEEGQRYAATFLASSALTAKFDAAWLDQTDAQGIPLRDAMQAAGLPGTLEAIAACTRDPSRYLGFVEVHIEQGPVLDSLDLPLGIVTSINGSRRYTGEVVGLASHAGTTPMNQRRDAAAGVAELILFAEQRAAAVPDVVATVGMLEVPSGSINVIPGRCRFSLDLRATTDEARDALDADVRGKLDDLCQRRGLSYTLQPTMAANAAPSDARWQARWEAAVTALGLPLHRLPSGAGHDAMKMHELLPQAMLFVRGGNGGISHNPLESVTVDDAELAVQAFQQLLEARAAADATVELVTVLPAHRQALQQGREHLSALLQVRLPGGWPQFPEAFDPDPADMGTEWPAFFFIDRAAGCLVGNGGFAGAPDAEGRLEIGYEIAPAHQGRGYATAAARALLDMARTRSGVSAVQAHTLAETNASNAVLSKIGMQFVAELPNEEVGKVWLWRLDLQPQATHS